MTDEVINRLAAQIDRAVLKIEIIQAENDRLRAELALERGELCELCGGNGISRNVIPGCIPVVCSECGGTGRMKK